MKAHAAPELALSVAVLLLSVVPIAYISNAPVTAISWAAGNLYYISYADYLRARYLPLMSASIFLLSISLTSFFVEVSDEVFLLTEATAAFSAIFFAGALAAIARGISIVTYMPQGTSVVVAKVSLTLAGHFVYCCGLSPLIIFMVALAVYRLVRVAGNVAIADNAEL